MTFQHFAILGPESEWAANAAECAREQNRFWDYYDLLYEHQTRGAFAKENLKLLGAGLGLNLAQFGACVDSDKYLAQVRADTEAGKTKGITSTPTFSINGQRVLGALPYEQYERIINIFLK
jgi:protein-disulfide isomerase